MWLKTRLNLNSDAQPKHTLWCLHFLRNYCTEDLNSINMDSTGNTIRSWIYQVLHGLKNLELVSYAFKIFWKSYNGIPAPKIENSKQIKFWNRFRNRNGGQAAPFYNCFISVDGANCPLAEPLPFDRTCYSFKINRAACRDEVGVYIDGTEIVWIHGPFKHSLQTDLLIFDEHLNTIFYSTSLWFATMGTLIYNAFEKYF